jgi:putative PIN family toxin of toxin-antitoxin system
MIVVLDTNVVVSALQFAGGRGTPVHALEKAVNSDFLTTCDEIDAEISRILMEKFRWPLQRVEAELQTTVRRAIRVTLRNTVHLCRDPDDNKILECAERANAALIVTGDKDLLSLRTHRRTRIVTPAAYLRV